MWLSGSRCFPPSSNNRQCEEWKRRLWKWINDIVTPWIRRQRAEGGQAGGGEGGTDGGTEGALGGRIFIDWQINSMSAAVTSIMLRVFNRVPHGCWCWAHRICPFPFSLDLIHVSAWFARIQSKLSGISAGIQKHFPESGISLGIARRSWGFRGATRSNR